MRPKALPHFVERYVKLLDASLWPTESGALARPTYQAVARRMESLGFEISVAHLARLRNAPSANPSAYYLLGLAHTFDVSPMVWFDEEAFTAAIRHVTELAARRTATLAPTSTDG